MKICMAPKVSIIVPVHNSAGTLERCIRSIKEQTLKDIEIILVENCSTDNSAELCRQFASEDSRIRVLQTDIADLSTARNAGVMASQGEYVGFADSDDTVEPEMFGLMYEAALTNDLDMVICNYRKIWPDGRQKTYFSQDGNLKILTAKEAVTLNLQEKISKLVWSVLYRRRLFATRHFPERMYNEDRASTFLFLADSKRVGIINKALYNYYQVSSSMSHTKNFAKYRDSFEADCMRLKFINDSGFYTSVKEKAKVAHRTANALLRKIGHMYSAMQTEAERQTLRSLLQAVSLIPRGTDVAIKQHLILFYVKSRLK